MDGEMMIIKVIFDLMLILLDWVECEEGVKE